MTFKVGDLAIAQFATYYHEHDGSLCEILAPLSMRRALDLRDNQYKIKRVYWGRILNGRGKCVCLQPWQLRRIDDPDQYEEVIRRRPDKIIDIGHPFGVTECSRTHSQFAPGNINEPILHPR